MRRKCRRMMAFTADRLYIVKVDDGKAKDSYPLKSVQLAPSDKINQASVVRQNAYRTETPVYRGACMHHACTVRTPGGDAVCVLKLLNTLLVSYNSCVASCGRVMPSIKRRRRDTQWYLVHIHLNRLPMSVLPTVSSLRERVSS